MKIHQLLSGIGIALTNEETAFIEQYSEIRISALNEHDQWIAQNLVRKGVYEISTNNNNMLVKK